MLKITECILNMNYHHSIYEAKKAVRDISLMHANCILLMYYLQENERKAQMKQNKKLIERCNEKELEYNEMARYYEELQEKYVRATNEREQMEFRRNRSRYKK